MDGKITRKVETHAAVIVDLSLAQRLERAEATASAAFVEARREVEPSIGAEWVEIAGVYAMFDGEESPITQTFGLGVFDPIGDRELDQLEAFFVERGAPTHHEVSALADSSIWNLLSARGYTPIETSTVLVRPTGGATLSVSTSITTRVIDASDAATWSRVAGEGWGSESAEIGTMVESLGAAVTRAKGARCFLAEVNGEPIAAGALYVVNGIALLAGASTIPSARKQGGQSALLQARLNFAREMGIDLAMVVAAPGSSSQRNAVRRGFRPVYTRSKWKL